MKVNCAILPKETLIMTTPTHKQQDDVSCSKMSMGATLHCILLRHFEYHSCLKVHILKMEHTFFSKIGVYIFFNTAGIKK